MQWSRQWQKDNLKGKWLARNTISYKLLIKIFLWIKTGSVKNYFAHIYNSLKTKV